LLGRASTHPQQLEPTSGAACCGVYGLLLVLNVGVWILTLLAARSYPLLLPAGVLAYTFGLRHASTPDHIAAIDNSTRKLMQQGERPVGVGFFFSLGHSTIVVLLTVLIAISSAVIDQMPELRSIGGVVGTSVSALFLLLIGLVNLVVFLDIYRMFRGISRGGAYDEQSLEDFLDQRGLLARFFRPAFRLIQRSWHLYPLGVLFGLGFDTATEVAVLGLAATSGAGHVPILLILLLPALFAAGMSLVDTTDGVMMLGAYGWAFVKPIRKLYYNLTITLVSVIIAFVIGGIEALAVIGSELHLEGGLWSVASNLDFGTLGIGIVATLVIVWLSSTLFYRWKGYDRLPVRVTALEGDRGA